MDDIEIVFAPAPWHDNNKPCIVTVGNLGEGFRFYGPFPNAETAIKWVSSESAPAVSDEDTWDLIELLTPEGVA